MWHPKEIHEHRKSDDFVVKCRRCGESAEIMLDTKLYSRGWVIVGIDCLRCGHGEVLFDDNEFD